jgi:hypothetical protein
MNLAEQVQSLIDGAPDLESQMSVAAIAPILQQAAKKLPSLAYYVRQSPQGEWMMVTLQNRQQPKLEIRVVYAFSRVQDITKFGDGKPSNDIAVEIPAIHLLFEMLSMPEIDRVIFLNNSSNLNSGQEITRKSLEESIAKAFQGQTLPAQHGSSLPPDVC